MKTTMANDARKQTRQEVVLEKIQSIRSRISVLITNLRNSNDKLFGESLPEKMSDLIDKEDIPSGFFDQTAHSLSLLNRMVDELENEIRRLDNEL